MVEREVNGSTSISLRRASIWQLEMESKNSDINHSLGIDGQLLKKKNQSYLCALLRNDPFAFINFTTEGL